MRQPHHFLCYVCLGAFTLAPLLGSKLHPNDYEGGRSRDVEARYQRNSSAVASMLGEFRTSMSDILFLKTERYLHSGVGYTSHINKRLMSVSSTAASNFAHQQTVDADKDVILSNNTKEDSESSLLIPDDETDFRGFIGELNREVKPWLPPDQHASHTDGKEVLPWFRVMTMSDPHYVRGYAVGGWWLKSININEAMEFLEEGMRNNPEAFQIYVTYGDVLQTKARKISLDLFNPTPDSLEYLLRARDIYQEAAEIVIRKRPKKYDRTKEYPDWTIHLEEDATTAVNMAVLFERQYGNAWKTKELLGRYLPLFPDNPTLQGVFEKSRAESLENSPAVGPDSIEP